MTQWLISMVSAWGYIAISVTMAGERTGMIIWSEVVIQTGGAVALIVK